MGSSYSHEYPFGTVTSFNPLYDDFCKSDKVEIERDDEYIFLRTLEAPYRTLQIDTMTGIIFFGNEKLNGYDMEFKKNISQW